MQIRHDGYILHWCRVLVLAGATVAFAACNSSSAPPSTPSDPPSDPAPSDPPPSDPPDEGSDAPSEEELAAADQQARQIDAVHERLELLLPATSTPPEQRDFDQEARQLAQDLLELDDVVTTIYDPNTLTVQVVFDDGFSIIVTNNRPAQQETAEDADLLLSRANTTFGLPGSKRAVALAIDFGHEVAAEVGGLLTQGGYELEYLLLGGSLSEMMQNFRNLGALYLDTHGVSYSEVSVTPRDDGGAAVSMGASRYGLQTNLDLIADKHSLLGSLQEELNSGRVIINLIEKVDSDNGNAWQATLAITEKFIEEYWSFDNGVVMIHACFIGSEPFSQAKDCYGDCPSTISPLDPAPLRQALLNAGAEVLVTFDNLTNADMARPSILYFFDRMLGTDAYQPQDPPLRPFDWEQVRAEMELAGLTSFVRPPLTLFDYPIAVPYLSNTVNLRFEGSPWGGTLAPSIATIDVIDDAEEAAGELILKGIFGTHGGVVQIDGVEAQVVDWQPDELRVTVPFTGSGSSGPVTVTTADTVKSNVVPLTEWTGTVTMVMEPANMVPVEAEIKLDLVFRADVHAYRPALGGEPLTRRVSTYVSPASSGQTSTSGVSVSEDTVMALTGASVLSVEGKTDVDFAVESGMFAVFDSFGGLVVLDPGANSARLCLGALTFFDWIINDTVIPDAVPMALDQNLDWYDSAEGGLNCFNATLTSDYRITAGQRSTTLSDTTFRINWTEFVPTSPPTDDTAG